jgi:hypothetical protein
MSTIIQENGYVTINFEYGQEPSLDSLTPEQIESMKQHRIDINTPSAEIQEK